jgi:hypothetical protein
LKQLKKASQSKDMLEENGITNPLEKKIKTNIALQWKNLIF